VNAHRRPGLRFVVEAVVIVLTAVGSGLLHLGVWGIIAAVAVAWVIVAIVEYSLSHPKAKAPAEPVSAEPDEVPEQPEPEPVAVEPEPAPEPEVVADTVPVSDAVEPEPEPEVVSDTVPVSDTVEPEPEPEPVAEEPEPEPEPAPEPEPVVPRQWNIWELEQALRAGNGANEEQEFLLLYLRDFAGPDGLLPLDFDALVRESFGDLLGTPAA
jgi:hypothetical protein